MKFLSCIGAAIALCAATTQAAVVLNDGTTTDGLVRLAPPPTSGIQNTTLTTTAQENLLASVTQDFFDLAMHTAWYATAYVATGGTFSASAEFTPETTAAFLDGGVVAWLDETASRGIVFALRKTSSRTFCQVAVYDFAFGTRVSSLLFDTEGNEVDPGFAPPLVPESPLLPGFVPTNPLRLQLHFEPPSTNDTALVEGATAKLTAVGIQDNGSGDQTVTTPIVLLTKMPEPTTGESYAGYYAVFNDYLDRTGPIGRLDNLILDGELGLGNQLPTISLTAPQDGQKFASGEPIDLSANALDTDGSIAQVEFFADSVSLGLATQTPYTYSWTSAAIGAHTLTAVTTDNRGASRTSNAVSIEVTNRPPVVALIQPAEGQQFPPGSGVVIEAEASDPDGTVTLVQFFVDDVLVSGTTVPPYSTTWFAAQNGTFTLTAAATDDRGASTTSGPITVQIGQVVIVPAVMTVEIVDGQVIVSWDRTGFQLRYASSLLGPWSDVAQDTTGLTQYSEPVSTQPKYYDLVARGVSPTQPRLAISRSGTELTLTWDQTGYQLQETSNLETAWQDVNTSTTGIRQYSTPASDPGRFFRLRP